MRKYLMVDLYDGSVTELGLEEFKEAIEDCDEIKKSKQFKTYKFEEYMVIEDLIAELDY